MFAIMLSCIMVVSIMGFIQIIPPNKALLSVTIFSIGALFTQFVSLINDEFDIKKKKDN